VDTNASDLSTRLSKNLRAARTCRGLSQEALAQSSGLHRTYVGSIERGERNVTLLTLQRIASALEVDPLELLREPGQWPNQVALMELT
jgi:transcriptional regulator with XRE-family HTH domain